MKLLFDNWPVFYFVLWNQISCCKSKTWLLFCSDMGCHIDGFIAVVAHTHVLQGGPITGRAAHVLAAANTAAEVALRLVRPGKKVMFNPSLCLFWHARILDVMYWKISRNVVLCQVELFQTSATTTCMYRAVRNNNCHCLVETSRVSMPV